MIRGLEEPLCYEDRLRELLFSLTRKISGNTLEQLPVAKGKLKNILQGLVVTGQRGTASNSKREGLDYCEYAEALE